MGPGFQDISFWCRGLEHYFDNKVLFKNNRPIVFQLFLRLTKLQTVEKTMSLLFLNNTFSLNILPKPFAKKKDPRSWVPFCTFLHPVVILNSYLTEKIPEVHINNQVC